MKCAVRPMTMADLSQVAEIDRESFPQPSPRDHFQRELTVNPIARYLVLCQNEIVIGYIGIWLIVGEIHITSIAVGQSHRRKGSGERLLVAAIDLALEHDAQLITLEVRKSNAAARGMYHKFGFIEVGVRPRYYTETGEDAVLMNAEDIAGELFQQNFQRLKRGIAVRQNSCPK